MIDLAPSFFGLGSSAFDFFKEREKNRKIDQVDQKLSKFKADSNWKIGKLNKVSIIIFYGHLNALLPLKYLIIIINS